MYSIFMEYFGRKMNKILCKNMLCTLEQKKAKPAHQFWIQCKCKTMRIFCKYFPYLDVTQLFCRISNLGLRLFKAIRDLESISLFWGTERERAHYFKRGTRNMAPYSIFASAQTVPFSARNKVSCFLKRNKEPNAFLREVRLNLSEISLQDFCFEIRLFRLEYRIIWTTSWFKGSLMS